MNMTTKWWKLNIQILKILNHFLVYEYYFMHNFVHHYTYFLFLFLRFTVICNSPFNSIYFLTWQSFTPNVGQFVLLDPLISVVISYRYFLSVHSRKFKSSTAYPNLPYMSVQRSRGMDTALKNFNWKVCCVNGWCKYVCVCACLHLGLCQTLPSPAAILPPHPKLARAHTHMQNIPQEPRREWQAGAGGGETSQEANRCSPSGFSQVAYIKRRREKSRKRWKHPWGWAGRTHFFPRAPGFFFCEGSSFCVYLAPILT